MPKYQDLSNKRKDAIKKNAEAYNKENYRQLKMQVKPELLELYNNVCKKTGLSKPKLLELLLNEYEKTPE